MKVAVIGAGVAGLTTAWELVSKGHEVLLFENLRGTAEATSFASAGLMAPAALATWDLAAPVWPATIRQSLTPPPAWLWRSGGLRWWRQMRRSRTPETAAVLANLALKLGNLGQSGIQELANQLHLTPEVGSGLLLLLRTEADRKGLEQGLAWLKSQGEVVAELSNESARTVERALSSETPFSSALHLPSDGVFNGRQWLSMLKNEAAKLGCQFAFNTQVLSVGADGHMVSSPAQDHQSIQDHRFDAIVLCSGSVTPRLLKPLGIELPTLNLDHCSVTAPVREPLDAPDSAVLDTHLRACISRTGQRVRVSSATPLLPGADASAVFKQLYKVLNDWFPGAARFAGPKGSVQEWRGTCSYMPDGLPAVGLTSAPGLWINTAYGARGWTLAPGCASLLASQMSGEAPAIDMSALSPQRMS